MESKTVRKLICYIDGACEPTNPGGHMGIGVAIFEAETAIFKHSEHIFQSKRNSNNVAEYIALHSALDWLIEQGLTNEDILVRGDSMLVVNQMGGSWGINKGLYVPFAYDGLNKKSQFSSIRFEWIPREMNDFADTLSKKSLIGNGVKITKR